MGLMVWQGDLSLVLLWHSVLFLLVPLILLKVLFLRFCPCCVLPVSWAFYRGIGHPPGPHVREVLSEMQRFIWGIVERWRLVVCLQWSLFSPEMRYRW